MEKHKPRDKKYYDITLSGLILFLSEKENWLDKDLISDVARTHPKLLPLVFGNWDFFVTRGARDEVIKKLEQLFSHKQTARKLYFCSKGIFFPPWAKKLDEDKIIEAEFNDLSDEDKAAVADYLVQNQISKWLIFQGLDPYWYNLYELEINGKPHIDSDIIKWVNLLIENKKLRKYITEQLKQYRADFNERLHHIKSWENLIKKALKRRCPPRQVARKPLSREEEKLMYGIHRRLFENNT